MSSRQKKAIIILVAVIVLAMVGNLAYKSYKEKNKIISFSEAVEIAKEDAGIDIMKKNVVSLGDDIYEDGKIVRYEVEFKDNNKAYYYVIDAKTGKIIDSKAEKQSGVKSESDFTEQGNSWQDDFIAIMDKENYLCSDIVADLRGADVKKTEEDDGSTVFVISRADKNGKDIHNIQYAVKDDLLVSYHYKNYSFKSGDSEKIGKNEAEKMVNSFAEEFIPGGEKLKFENNEDQQVQSLYDKGKVETWYAKDGNREYHIVIDLEKGYVVYYYMS